MSERNKEIKRQIARIEEIQNGPVVESFFGVEYDPRGDIPTIERIINRLEKMSDIAFIAEIEEEKRAEEKLEADAVKPLRR